MTVFKERHRSGHCIIFMGRDDVCSSVQFSELGSFSTVVCGAVICCFCAGRVRLWLKGRCGGRGPKMRHRQTDGSEWVGGHRAVRGQPFLSLFLCFFLCVFLCVFVSFFLSHSFFRSLYLSLHTYTCLCKDIFLFSLQKNRRLV